MGSQAYCTFAQVLTSVTDPKHFGADPDPEFDIRAIRIGIFSFFQHAWRKLVLLIFKYAKTYMALHYMFKSNDLMYFL